MRRLGWLTPICASTALLAGTAVLTGASALPAAAAASKAPIVIGGVDTTADFPGANFGFQARIARQNKEGGVDGHPIKFIGALDDGGSGTTNLTDVQNLILKDHVVAIAPVVSLGMLSSSVAFAADHKTPFVGWGFLPGFCNNKWGWGFNGCLEPTGIYNLSLVDPIIKRLGGNAKKLRVAILADDNQSGISANTLFKGLFPKLGSKIVYISATMPYTGVTDYSSYVTAILAAKPNLVQLGASFSEGIAMAAALKQAGYKGAIMDFQSYVPGLLSAQPSVATALQGEYIDSQIPPQESGSPATKQESKDLVAIGQPPLISQGASVGYWSADVLIQMLQATIKAHNPLTGAGLEKTVNAGFTYKGRLAGGVGPAPFPKSEKQPVPCAALVQVSGKKYTVATPFACYKNLVAK